MRSLNMIKKQVVTGKSCSLTMINLLSPRTSSIVKLNKNVSSLKLILYYKTFHGSNGTARFFAFSRYIEGTIEKVLQFIVNLHQKPWFN